MRFEANYFVILLVLVAIMATSKAEDLLPKGFENLQGRWDIVAYVDEGRLSICERGHSYSFFGTHARRSNPCIIKALMSKVSLNLEAQPNRMRFVTTVEGEVVDSVPAIYEINKRGDRMILCIGDHEGMCPTSFDTRQSKHALYILVRRGGPRPLESEAIKEGSDVTE